VESIAQTLNGTIMNAATLEIVGAENVFATKNSEDLNANSRVRNFL
jgi:hypothetical protein